MHPQLIDSYTQDASYCFCITGFGEEVSIYKFPSQQDETSVVSKANSPCCGIV